MDNLDFVELDLTLDDFDHLLNEHRKEKRFIDVILKVGDQTFDAHRNVISLHSPVLEAAVSDQSSMICPINDEFVNPEIMEDLLNFLYTGKIKLKPDNAHSICLAANYLKVSTLLEHSVDHLCRLVTVDNVFTLLYFSDSCQLKLLREECLRIIHTTIQLRNYEKFLHNDQILQLSFEAFKDVIVVFKERLLGMLPEQIYHCIARWTEKNFIERSNHLPILLKNIPLKGLVSDRIAEAVLQNDQILEYSFDDFKKVIIGLQMCSSETVQEQTFLYIVRWTEQNFNERSNHLPFLLKNILLEEFPSKFLAEVVLRSDHILQFSFEDFSDVIVRMKMRFCSSIQKQIFHSIVRWTEQNPIERSNHFPCLLRNILLGSLPPKFLAETVLQSDRIFQFSFEDFKDLIIRLRIHYSETVREHTFYCIVRWTGRNFKRSSHLPILLRDIPLEELSSEFLAKALLTNEQILLFSFENFKEVIVRIKIQIRECFKQTYDCISRWIEKNPLERSRQGTTLLKAISLPTEYLERAVSSSSWRN